MKIAILYSLLSFVFCAGIYAQSFNSFSRQIQVRCHERSRGYPAARLKLYKEGRLPFIFYGDTSYILQAFAVESGTFHGAIWNNAGHVYYSYTMQKVKIDSMSYFTDFMSARISQWDTVIIRAEERRAAVSHPQTWVTGVRVIREKDKKLKIDHISFKYFIDPKRDAIY